MSVERGSLLYNTGRFEAAETEFRQALSMDPQNALAHAMLGMCLVRREQFDDAAAEAQAAIGLQPDWAVGYACLAKILFERQHFKPAMTAVSRAIALDSFNPNYHALAGFIFARQSQWSDALAAADRGLQCDPADADCLNVRGMALVKLNRRDEAARTIEGALSEHPENANVHANQGWTLLHKGDHKAALHHFREALRLQPDLAWAKSGIIEALKARNPVYRLMLRYFLFMSRMNPRVRWGIIIGLYLLFRGVGVLKEQHPAIGPYVTPIIIAYIVFAVLTWLSSPLFNLLLLTDRFGRHALSKDQRRGATLLGVWLAVTISTAAIGWWRGDERLLLIAMVIGLTALPAAVIFNMPSGWPRFAMGGYTGLLLVIGVAPLLIILPQGGDLFQFFLYGIVASTFVASALANASVKR